MGGNSVKNAPDLDASAAPVSPSSYKPHQSPSQSPSQEPFYTPTASPERHPAPMDTGPTPMDTSPTPEEPRTSSNEQKYLEGWGASFHRALEQIQQASHALDEMHSQLRGLLTSGNGSDGTRIASSALNWEIRLKEVKKELKCGLRDLGNLKNQYEALSAGNAARHLSSSGLHESLTYPLSLAGYVLNMGAGRPDSKDTQELTKVPDSQERHRPQQEDGREKKRLRDRVYQLERENVTLTQRIIELQGEVQDLNLLQSDLRTAVAVAERFREEAQEKLERSEKERLPAKGSDSVDWAQTSPVNGTFQAYRSLPRGVILSSLRDPIVKSSSLMSVPPRGSSTPGSGGDTAETRKERRGSLETLLNQSKATENLTEDSGSFLRRYGGSKRGVFLRWAQDRTCGYKHVVITNFSTSWVDGMALCALLHSYLPHRIPYDQLRPLEKRKNLQLAFQVAESVGIAPLLTVDHMLQTQGPDWQKVLLYVESIYQKFEA